MPLRKIRYYVDDHFMVTARWRFKQAWRRKFGCRNCEPEKFGMYPLADWEKELLFDFDSAGNVTARNCIFCGR